MTAQDNKREFTDIQEQFLNLLQKYPVKRAETVVDYVSSQGETVLEDPERLARALAECEITPVRRRQILKHWFAEKGLDLEEEFLHRATLPASQRKQVTEQEEAEKEKAKAKYSVDQSTGGIKVATDAEKALTWGEAQALSDNIKKELASRGKGTEVKYVYDGEMKQIRMAKQNEMGGTLDEAKELKKMAEEKEGGKEESPFVFSEEQGWSLRPGAKVSGLDILALDSLKRSHQRGETSDPLQALTEAAERMKIFREALGGGQEMPEWMRDPIKLKETMRALGGEEKGDEALRAELATLKETINEMRDAQTKERIDRQQDQISALSGRVKELTDYIADMRRPTVGKTAMDVIGDLTSEVTQLAKTELPGLRQDLRSILGGESLPQRKTNRERDERKGRIKGALEADRELEQLGNEIFFSSS